MLWPSATTQPEPKALSETEVLQRIEAGYGLAYRQALQQQLDRFRQQPDGSPQIQRLLAVKRRRSTLRFEVAQY